MYHDTGVGISSEAQTRLFEAFSQADGSNTQKYGGTGLGLSIARRLVEIMHGQMGVQSKTGEGSTFWFTVRLEKQPVNGATTDDRGVAAVRVLVVDDNATSRQVLCKQILDWQDASRQRGQWTGGIAEVAECGTRGQSLQPCSIGCTDAWNGWIDSRARYLRLTDPSPALGS
jgi:two-component system sensor histidine kinase/response regulator